jgi:nitrite reductase/ring-hydroxylating ferredoxin subunit
MSVPGPADTVRAGGIDEFVLNKFRIVDTPVGSVGVVRTSKGFFAVRNRCPHMDGPICLGSMVTSTTAPSRPFEYLVDHEHAVVRCPWHRWEFDIATGENVGRITRARLATYRVELRDREVFVVGCARSS